MKRLIVSDEKIFCMSNVTGKYVKNPERLNFSFYYSSKSGVKHGIRVKPVFNPEKISKSEMGNLELHGSWEFTPGNSDKSVNTSDINKMKNFFKTYKVLFAAVWEEQVPEDLLADYFKGYINLTTFIEELYNYSDWQSYLSDIKDVSSFEKAVRENNLFNMND